MCSSHSLYWTYTRKAYTRHYIPKSKCHPQIPEQLLTNTTAESHREQHQFIWDYNFPPRMLNKLRFLPSFHDWICTQYLERRLEWHFTACQGGWLYWICYALYVMNEIHEFALNFFFPENLHFMQRSRLQNFIFEFYQFYCLPEHEFAISQLSHNPFRTCKKYFKAFLSLLSFSILEILISVHFSLECAIDTKFYSRP